METMECCCTRTVFHLNILMSHLDEVWHLFSFFRGLWWSSLKLYSNACGSRSTRGAARRPSWIWWWSLSSFIRSATGTFQGSALVCLGCKGEGYRMGFVVTSSPSIGFLSWAWTALSKQFIVSHSHKTVVLYLNIFESLCIYCKYVSSLGRFAVIRHESVLLEVEGSFHLDTKLEHVWTVFWTIKLLQWLQSIFDSQLLV